MQDKSFAFTLPTHDAGNTLKQAFVKFLIQQYPEITIIGTEVDGSTAHIDGRGIQFAPAGSTVVFRHKSDEWDERADVLWYDKSYKAYLYHNCEADMNLHADLQEILKLTDEYAKNYYPEYHVQPKGGYKASAVNTTNFFPEYRKVYNIGGAKTVQEVRFVGDAMYGNNGLINVCIPSNLSTNAKFKYSNTMKKMVKEIDQAYKNSGKPETKVKFTINL